MYYPEAAVERAMRMQEVILRAIGGQIHWFQAAEILGVSVRTVRRWRRVYEHCGYDGLFDRRKRRPSPRRVPYAQVEAVLQLYRERYADFNVKHFHEKLGEEHGIRLSYTWVKTALQMAGLVQRQRQVGPHRKRRPRRPLPGMLLHLDASRHYWLPLCPQQQDDLLVLMDDADNTVYGALLVQEEDTRSVLKLLHGCICEHGVFCELYTDRASHFTFTPRQGQQPLEGHVTQVGRVLKQLGIRHILAHSPQARGRCERLFGTWQGRLPQELRLRGIRNREAANAYLCEHFVPAYNHRFRATPQQAGSAFVRAPARATLERIFCLEYTRRVANDNTLTYGKRILQLGRQRWRYSFARTSVTVREHLDGQLSLWYGPRLLGRYDRTGRSLKVSPGSPGKEVA